MRSISWTILQFTALALLAAPVAADLGEMPAGVYKLDKAHGYINFSYSHVGFSTPTVGFRDFDVELELNSSAPADSKLAVTIDAASIDSRVDDFDAHLRGEDFFDVAVHPRIVFATTGIKMTGPNTAAVTGDLTIVGVSRPVTLDAVLNKAGVHPVSKAPTLGVNATTVVKRSDWGLGYAVPLVSDAVQVNISVELAKQ